jgi:hypothetical protein
VSKKEKPLPKPSKTPFGRKRRSEEGKDQAPLIADEMAMAMAQGKLEDFIRQELPDNEHARKLASMMMQMSGMSPHDGFTPTEKKKQPGKRKDNKDTSGQKEVPAVPPEDIMKAVQGGNVNDLMGLLKREHEKRNPDAGSLEQENIKPSPGDELSRDEKKVIDQLVQIAAENKVTLDWITLRALKVYVQEYLRTGKL